MLSVPTLWTVLTVNFLAVGLVWSYVMTSYPKFTAARFWAAASLVLACGSCLSIFRGVLNAPLPLIGGGCLMIASSALAAMGLQRFYGRPVSWRLAASVVLAGAAGLTFFLLVRDDIVVRVVLYSLAQSIPLAVALPLVVGRAGGRTRARGSPPSSSSRSS